MSQAAALPASPVRGQGDAWGVHRRLAALAEACHQFPVCGADPADLAARAVDVGPGLAGITAPACLTVAEAASVAAPGDIGLAERAVAAAEQAAHNIQDFTFCSRTTARVTAMRERWWPSPPLDPAQVAAAIDRLSRDRSAPEFSAMHVVGEDYQDRAWEGKPLMPSQMLTAATLEELATVYDRPIEEFLRHNRQRGWAPDERLPAGTRVNVPDPDYPPLVAARLAAAVLAGGPPGPELATQLRHLVPVTGADVTAGHGAHPPAALLADRRRAAARRPAPPGYRGRRGERRQLTRTPSRTVRHRRTAGADAPANTQTRCPP